MMYGWWSWWVHRPDWFWITFLIAFAVFAIAYVAWPRRKR